MTALFFFVITAGPLARIESTQELIYVTVLDVLCGLSLFGIAALNCQRKVSSIVAILALAATAGLVYLHWSTNLARMHATDYRHVSKHSERPTLS